MSEPASQIFHVSPEQTGRTLSAALRGWIEGQSWSDIDRLVCSRRVLVNGNLCVDAGRRLKAAEVVKVLSNPTAAPPTEHDIKIRHLDQHVVVVEKPAGITSIRHVEERNWSMRRKQIQPTLEEMLPVIIGKLSSSRRSRARERDSHRGQAANQSRGHKGTNPPVRPVHRIDRETSGLMVFARTISAERSLGEQFRHHTTERRYVAVAAGRVESQTISARLVRDRGDGRRGTTADADAGKAAVTHVKQLEDLGDFTLIECRLETGRTHQIRIHLADIGHPLCGERIYNQLLRGKSRVDKSGAPRLALHAAELAFTHPATDEKMRFETPLPEDLQQFVDRLREKRNT